MKLLLLYLAILVLGLVIYTTFKKQADAKGLYLKFISFAATVLVTYAILAYAPRYIFWLYASIAIVVWYEIIRCARRLRAAYAYIVIALTVLVLFLYTSQLSAFPHAALFLCVLSFDAFSQFFGQIFGKHALSRRISPHKTLEGSIGGLLVCILSSFFTLKSASTGVYIACFALAGDLLASFVKRQAGIKDFGKILPGQGGILDRFDSYIITAIFYTLFL